VGLGLTIEVKSPAPVLYARYGTTSHTLLEHHSITRKGPSGRGVQYEDPLELLTRESIKSGQTRRAEGEGR